jgi:hypothetical protein
VSNSGSSGFDGALEAKVDMVDFSRYLLHSRFKDFYVFFFYFLISMIRGYINTGIDEIQPVFPL